MIFLSCNTLNSLKDRRIYHLKHYDKFLLYHGLIASEETLVVPPFGWCSEKWELELWRGGGREETAITGISCQEAALQDYGHSAYFVRYIPLYLYANSCIFSLFLVETGL